MIIGIDGSRAFLKYRTGIEEYSYQVIKHLRGTLPKDATVRLYVRKKIVFKHGKFRAELPAIDFSLPGNWQLVGLWAPRFWTQIRLSFEMLTRPVDTLLIPAHTVPVIHPKNTVVVIHGLEYEMCKNSYSLWERFYMRSSITYSVRAAKKIIAVSHNTKSDLRELYQVPAEKMSVIHEGYEDKIKNQKSKIKKDIPYILFIGRIEERKNVGRIIEAFENLKKRYQIPHTLVLAGKPGYGYQHIESRIKNSEFNSAIKELGYITQEQKEELLLAAAVFIFPSLYEGFGLPILEAQAAGALVLTSNTSSLPEVAGVGAVYADPYSGEEIAEKLYLTLTLPEDKREELVKRGRSNLGRFSWVRCAEKIAQELTA